jgi:putative flippase GtrA
MSSATPLTERLRHLAPEALAFGAIGAANSLLYLAITYWAMSIGVVKVNVVATVITTTLAYVANRYWTYRHHSRSRLRREYTLFFGFNLIGLIIQTGVVGGAKYGLHLTEAHDKHTLMGATIVGIGIATVFRFWAYRTFVFLKPVPELDPVAGLAEASVTPQPRAGADDFDELEAELVTELDAEQRAPR